MSVCVLPHRSRPIISFFPFLCCAAGGGSRGEQAGPVAGAGTVPSPSWGLGGAGGGRCVVAEGKASSLCIAVEYKITGGHWPAFLQDGRPKYQAGHIQIYKWPILDMSKWPTNSDTGSLCCTLLVD